MLRKIITIDEAKCNGCGECVPACAEGAIQIIDGKAKLVSEVYCDGLGACLGECPMGAITLEEREAEAFDENAVERRQAGRQQDARAHASQPEPVKTLFSGGCPGAAARTLVRQEAAPVAGAPAQSSSLGNWPVQLHLVPPNAPYLRGAKLLISADCVPFAFADFHRRLLDGRTLVVGCPKLDDVAAYREKLTALFRDNEIASAEVAYMEVPCCFALVHLVRAALEESGAKIPCSIVKVGIGGELIERSSLDAEA